VHTIEGSLRNIAPAAADDPVQEAFRAASSLVLNPEKDLALSSYAAPPERRDGC